VVCSPTSLSTSFSHFVFSCLTDPDLTSGDGVYSRYIVPPSSIQSRVIALDITVYARTSPSRSKYVSKDRNALRRDVSFPRCCGSTTPVLPSSLKIMPFNERVMSSYMVKISNIQKSDGYRPARIGDARVAHLYGTQLTLSFTAPGDDLDHGQVDKYMILYRRSFESKPIPLESFSTEEVLPGTQLNRTITLPSYGLFYLNVIAIDAHKLEGKLSNTVHVRAEDPPSVNHGGQTDSQVGSNGANGNGGRRLGKAEIAAIVGGSFGFVVLLALIIVLCLYCRRRESKGMGSTETKISTISDTKAPIHWSASQLLSEHEKRQSIYAPGNQGLKGEKESPDLQIHNHNNLQQPPQNPQHQQPPHHLQYTSYNPGSGSPGSSTRSCRSSENNRNALIDYDSCSSDPALKGMKGPLIGYDTPVESDPEHHFHHVDGFQGGGGVPYRYNGHGPPCPPPRGGNYPVTPSTLSGSHLQYNPSIQGSLTSVSSKRRNITMV